MNEKFIFSYNAQFDIVDNQVVCGSILEFAEEDETLLDPRLDDCE